MATRYTAWKWSDEKGDWRKVKSRKPWQKKYRTSYTADTAAALVKKLRFNGHKATARTSASGKPQVPPSGKSFKDKSAQKWALIHKWLTGDLDANLDLMYAIAQVARDTNESLYIAEGTRSYAEQLRLWTLKKAGKISWPVAFPGTSRHGTGNAADVRERAMPGTPNIGDSKARRAAMAKYGLCLPVAGEPWHVEFGSTWRA